MIYLLGTPGFLHYLQDVLAHEVPSCLEEFCCKSVRSRCFIPSHPFHHFFHFLQRDGSHKSHILIPVDKMRNVAGDALDFFPSILFGSEKKVCKWSTIKSSIYSCWTILLLDESFRENMWFCWQCWIMALWKNMVFHSPSLSYCTLDFFFHNSSSCCHFSSN